MTENKYPLYPTLSEAGKEEAQNLVDDFIKVLTKAAEEAISRLYTDLTPHIESDSWTNYRNDMMAGFKDYGNRMVQGEHDFKEIRQAIYKEFRKDIIKDLNQDLVKENEDLKRQLEQERAWHRRY